MSDLIHLIDNSDDSSGPAVPGEQGASTNEQILVYTDGACSNNGSVGAKAGVGVFFGEGDPRNLSQRVAGKQTNNTAELTAIISVNVILREHIASGGRVTIYSDSQYAIRCCTSYGAKLYRNNWKGTGKNPKPVPNIDLVRQAYLTYKDHENVQFAYVRAHTGAQDRHSIGNDGADRLANVAIGHNSCPYARSNQDSPSNKSKQTAKPRIYLDIPYREKDEGKPYGTRWDPRRKKWYIYTDSPHLNTVLSRWNAV